MHGFVICMQNSFNLGPLLKLHYMKEGNISPAVAARVYGDKSYFHRCGFMGFQDTLFDSTGRHYFEDCYIQGEVDFIFGYAQSFYKVINKYKFFYLFLFSFYLVLKNEIMKFFYFFYFLFLHGFSLLVELRDQRNADGIKISGFYNSPK